MEKIIIRNTQSPGDLIVLTAALRDLHRAHPGRFSFGVDVSERAVFLNNPYVDLHQKDGRVVVAKYPSIHKSNQRQLHFMWSFLEYLNKELKANAVLTEFKPDLHLSAEERSIPPLGRGVRYWVMVSGGKMDFTAKWWTTERWQAVVNGIKDRFEVVQVGGTGNQKHPHVHPVLQGTRNLIGQTSFRELSRLIYHSEGVLCVVTCLMHIAAAFNKPCVTVAGGREPWWWEAYNQESRLLSMRHGMPDWQPPARDTFIPQQYLHTMNQLSCCMNRGCWKSHPANCPPEMRVRLSGPSRTLPKCMDLIQPEHVLRAIDQYYQSKAAPVLIKAPVKPLEVVSIFQPYRPDTLKQITVAVQCKNGTRVEQCTQLISSLSSAAEFVFMSAEANSALETMCRDRGLSFSVGPTFGLQIKKAAAHSVMKFFVTLPIDWQMSEKNLHATLARIRADRCNVAGLVYKKNVDDSFQARFQKPLIRNQRQGHGYTVFFPGKRLFAAHTDFVRGLEAEQLEDPVLLGESIRQQGGQLIESGVNFEHS